MTTIHISPFCNNLQPERQFEEEPLTPTKTRTVPNGHPVEVDSQAQNVTPLWEFGPPCDMSEFSPDTSVTGQIMKRQQQTTTTTKQT